MPKVRRARQKFHDLPPHSRHLGGDPPEGGDALGIGTPSFLAQSERSHSTEKAGAENQERRVQASVASLLRGVGRGGREAAVSREKIGATLDQSFSGLSKGQRRRLAKREAWLRKFDFVGYARAVESKKKEEEARAQPLFNFEAIRGQLEVIGAEKRRSADAGATAGAVSAPERRGKISRKTHQRVARRELQQFDAVLNFPAFRESPLAALKLHIENSLSLQRLHAEETGETEGSRRKKSAERGKTSDAARETLR
ncbi:hypothetical protein TGGT1_297760 [Toxoplasma gondii GT1]|uniref:Uncharacterized protein n=3 Tax=Toxoplasma gondii TaxID=5811 RepID=S7UKV2_TOXGG|nr:hypothetical protein TGGT1_297760 [Toxoplasma gondii GT1]KAF4645767.1 hypothetical protein TGRH88_002530 [Toxoplasma gondii]KFG39990.1 hypothetical protein TGFOU_297760 [Toxoplasma gondii FOU]